MKNISNLIPIPYRKRTITSDLTIGLVVIASITLMLVGLISTYLTAMQMEADLNIQAKDTSKKLADILSIPLWTLDIQDVQKIGEIYKQSKNVSAIRIDDENKNTLFTAQTVETDQITSGDVVYYKNHPIGYVEIALSKRAIRAAQVGSFLTTMLGILLVVLTIMLGTRILLQRFLNHPIEALTKGLDTIANGHNYFGLKSVPQTDINEIIQRVNSMAQQIGDRVTDLQKVSSRYQTFISASNTGAWEYDDPSGFMWCSPEYFSMLGRDIRDFDMTGARNIEQAWIELLHPDDRDRVRQHFANYLEQHSEGMWEQNFRMLHSDGHWVWIWSRGKTLPDQDGSSPHITVGTHIDITELKEVELLKETLFEIANAANSTRSMEELFHSIHISIDKLLPADNFYIAIYDAEKDEISFPFYVDQYDSTFPPQKLGRGVTEYVLRTGKALLAPAEVFDGLVRQGEMELVGEKSVDWLGVPLQVNDKAVGVMVVQSYNEKVRFYQREMDILSFVSSQVAMVIERKQAEEQVRQLNTDLERRVYERTASLKAANQELESFAYSVSHDLRSPLRTLDGFSALLLSDYGGQLDEQAQNFLHRIQEGSRRMGQLINDLLNLSRITRTELIYKPVDLSAMAREIATELQTQNTDRPSVEWDVSANMVVEGDVDLLKIALENLINNAFKFTSQREQVKIQVGIQDQAGERIYFVRDNGVGFDMAYADKLFTPFQRLHSVKEYPGTGIGLSIVQRIITRHGGRIWPESEIGQGTTFYFTLRDKA